MTIALWLLRAIFMWLGLALPVGVVIGRGIRLADRQRPTCDAWSTAVREEFDQLVPGFVTEHSFELDNALNHAAEGWEW